MYNWFENKQQIISKTINAIMDELDPLVNECDGFTTANYWLDKTHNVFAFIHDNGDEDKWIEIHYELDDNAGSDEDGDIIGDLCVVSTDGIDRDELLREVSVIVDLYYGQ